MPQSQARTVIHLLRWNTMFGPFRARLITLSSPQGVALDPAGNIFIADSGSQRVRKVDASTGVITTVVGTTLGYSGNGGPAAQAQLHDPWGLFFDASGNLYIADSFNAVIRKVTP